MTSNDPVKEFMNSALVTWVRTFENDGGGGITYSALADGVFLYDVLNHIDPRGGGRPVNRHPTDPDTRLANLAQVLHHVKTFYQEVLSQTVVLRLPDVVLISKAGETIAGVSELRQLLLLVLGVAVQCTRKEDVVNNITKLDIDTQHSIVECIKEVTDNPSAVWPGEWTNVDAVPEDQLETAFTLLAQHCKRLAQERDAFNQELLRALCGEGEEEGNSQESVHHLGVQLADAKAQLRRLRQEYDEKAEAVTEYKDELEQTKTVVAKLRQENVELVQDARAARAWRDEADILRERASRVDALEQEVTRYRDKMSDIEFYKTRVEELREDNRILVETKEMLEEQLASSRRRAEQVLDLENNILQLKQTINQLSIERDAEGERLQEVMEENAQLQLSTKNSLSETSTLVSQIDLLKTKAGNANGTSIGSDLIGDAQARVLKLQLENQRLEAELEQLKRENINFSSEKQLELDKENKRLSMKVTQLQDTTQRDRSQVLESQQEIEKQVQEKKRLQETINTVKENSERQLNEVQNEKSQLQELIESLRERQKKTTDTRLHDVEGENKRLMDTNLQLQSQVTRLEYEKQQLNRLTERLKESAETLSEVEHQKTEIERENRDLHRAICSFKESCERHEKLEHEHASLEVEYTRVSRLLTSLKETVAKLESVQSEKFELESEVERLNRSMSTLKTSSDRIADLETEKEQLLQQSSLMQKQLTNLKAGRIRAEQLDLELLKVRNEDTKRQRSLESVQKKLEEVEKDKSELENENTKLQRTVETLKITTKKLNELERDLTNLEGTNDRLERENKSLHKEVSRLRSAIEVKDSLIDEGASKVSTQERDIKRLSKDLSYLKANDNRLQELEREKRELEQQMSTERKTLVTLREDLVSEKVRTQQLSNQLDSLMSDLAKLGLNPDNLVAPASEANNDRYKILETMLEETLKRSVEVREEKISSLESRLNESVNRNKELRNQLMGVRSDYDSLQQRHQEEGRGANEDTKEISKLRKVHRQTEEEKESLEGEVTELKSQTASYREQVCALQSQVTSLSNQNTIMSKHNANLQGENARLQVENTTLQSQSASLIAQNSALQTSATQNEKELEKNRRNFEERGTRLTQLVSDHEALQRLHQQLTREYDTLVQDHNNLKTSLKNLKYEHKTLKERQNDISNGEDDLLKLREALETEVSKLKADSTSLSNLRAEHSRLKDDFRSLFSANEKLRTEYKNLQGDYKAIKTENNTLKLKLTELNGELNDTRDQMAALDVEVSKLTNKAQVLQTLNVTLEEDRRSLMSQVSLLLTQYHDLLTQTLEDKQHFHQEEKNFTDKLNNLRRQKEKLEEKIMDQYRRMDSSPSKKKGFGSNLVRRVRKAGNELISKTGRSRSRGRDEGGGGDSPDSSSLGSSSHANDSLDSGSETRRSSPNLPPSPPHDHEHGERLGRSGTLPHHYRKSLPPTINDIYTSQILRGSVSSEELVSLRSGDASDGHIGDDSLSTVTGGSNGTMELSRAGSRRPVYLTEDPDSIPTRDVGPEPLNDNQSRGRSSIRSTTSSTMSQQILNRNYNSYNNNMSAPGTPRTPTPNNSLPRSSTPKSAPGTRRERAVDDDTQPPTTPKLPPRAEHSTSAPQVPPRSRRGSSVVQADTLNSSQGSGGGGTTAPGTPEPQRPPRPPPRSSPPNTDNLKAPPPTKDMVDNSIWYEYGCV